MANVYLLIGGNLGDVKTNLSKTYDLINKDIGNVILSSSIVETEPWGFEHENNFLNQVFKVDTKMSPEELLSSTQSIEKKLGRIKNSAGYEARTMDIDILFYDEMVINNDNLLIPHPRMHLRRFTLYPLNEIASDFIHPLLKISVSDLLNNCEDKSELKIINN